MTNALNHKINFSFILKFVMPTIIMSLFMSIYTMVDGIFIARYVGENALSAVNIIFPLFCIIMAVGIMLATGGSAIVGKLLGEKKLEEARQNFTMITVVAVLVGVCISAVCLIFIKPLITFLGASDLLFNYCYDYAKAISLFAPFAMLQMVFQFFFMTSGKPLLGMCVIMLGGVVNIILDYVFIAVLGLGIAGAGIATGIGMTVPSIIGLIYFFFNRRGGLYFTKFRFRSKVLLNACYNGSSEMVANLASAVITYLFNLSMMKYVGETGVAAITVVMYTQSLLTGIFFGYSSGVSPLISFNYGKQNRKRLKKIYEISFAIILSVSLVVFIVSFFFGNYVVQIFVNKSSPVYDLAVRGFKFFSFAYVFMGLNIFVSAMFTALSKGKESAVISFLRTFVFIVGAIFLLPLIFAVDGIWLAIPVAECLAILVSATLFFKYRKRLYRKIALATDILGVETLTDFSLDIENEIVDFIEEKKS